MTHSRIAFPIAAALLLAAALPAAAQDVQGYSSYGAYGAPSAYGAAVGKYKNATAAYAQVPEPSCHMETWETGDHYTRYVTLCGQW